MRMTAPTFAQTRWLATALVLIVLGIGVACLANGARRVGRTFPGFLISNNRIVLSIGRRGWPVERDERILFAKVIAVEGHPLTTASSIDAYVARLGIDTPVSYRFRKEAEMFSARVDTTRFGLDDFLAVYAMYFLVGACFALAGHWALRRAAHVPASFPFFVLCQTTALALVTGGDVYGPYWFTPLYFTAHCLTPAALLHFASTFPEPLAAPLRWRRSIIVAVYIAMLGFAVLLNRVADDPSLFLPLIYTVYLLLATVLLLYLGRAVTSLWTIGSRDLRLAVRRAVIGFVLSATIPGVIFVIYPLLKKPISPVLLVAPLVLFPFWTASALRVAGRLPINVPAGSARQRLSLLFLGAFETALIAGIAVFWLSNSWQQLVDDLALNQHQHAVVDQLLSTGASPDNLGGIDELVQTVPERALVAAAAAALARSDPPAARAALEQLSNHYREVGDDLAQRRDMLGRLGAGLMLTLVVIGVVQAVAFMIAIRRWLIRPIERLAVATNVIATGQLQHRVALDAVSEFTMLADSINTMAASLAAIQQRVETEQEGRRRAAGAARDAERRRLSRELHDGTLQDISAVKLRLERAARLSPDGQFQPLVDGIIDVIVGLRRVIDDVGAPELSHTSLHQAIKSYAQALAEAQSVALELDLAETVDVPDWTTRDVYRIAQEALTNALRHASPSHILVRLTSASDSTLLEIADDGAGFDMQTVALGTGIRGMEERAAAIGATLDIVTAPRRGTLVRLKVTPTTARL